MLTASYWLVVTKAGSSSGGVGLKVLLALMILASLVGVLVALRRNRGKLTFSMAVASFALSIFATGGPLLLWLWTPGDSERYFWVIHQGYPCSAMGGGPGSLLVLGTSWLTALAALAYALTSSDPLRRIAVLGIGIGALALAATAVAMFAEPSVFARVLGCTD